MVKYSGTNNRGVINTLNPIEGRRERREKLVDETEGCLEGHPSVTVNLAISL